MTATASTTCVAGELNADCTHPRAKHVHGHHLTAGRDHCKGEACTRAARKHAKLTAYRRATGTSSYVAAGPARAHVLALLEVLTVGQIEARSGVHRTAIRVLTGDFPGKPASKRITRTTAAGLLSVTPVAAATETQCLVNATGTRRRLRALAALGWPMRHITERLGCSPRTTWLITHRPRQSLTVLASTRDAVAALYAELSTSPPPSTRQTSIVRRLAFERGWAPPAAWDDDTIDDPRTYAHGHLARAKRLDEIAIAAAVAGDIGVLLTAGERAEVIRRCLDASVTIDQTARRADVPRHVVRAAKHQALDHDHEVAA